MADMVYVLYDSGEDFEYLMDDALEKLSLEDGGAAAAPAKPKAAVGHALPPPPPSRPKPVKEAPPAQPKPPAARAKTEPPAAVSSHHESEHSHATVRSNGNHRGKGRGSGPQVGPGPKEGNDPSVQLMDLPIPVGPEDGTGNYRTLQQEWHKGPRSASGQALPIPDDEEDGIDELTLSEGDKPSKRLRNAVPLQSLITTLGDIWAKDNVL